MSEHNLGETVNSDNKAFIDDLQETVNKGNKAFLDDLVETVNKGNKAFLEKLRSLKPAHDASDSDVLNLLTSAADNLCLAEANVELKGKLKLKLVADLAEEVNNGFERANVLLENLPKEERARIAYSRTCFDEIFKGRESARKAETSTSKRIPEVEEDYLPPKRIRDEPMVQQPQSLPTLAIGPLHVSVNFTQRLDTGEIGTVHGVTKLQNKIYVLCQLPKSSASDSSSGPPLGPHDAILVFEDRIPFPFVSKIETNEMIHYCDIRSDKTENCLYMSSSYFVWKIIREIDGQHTVIKWIVPGVSFSSCLSMSRDGLLMTTLQNSWYLKTYGADAELLRSIKLPDDIKNPIHAVETSFGNFIILHEWLAYKDEYARRRSTLWGIEEVTRDGQQTNRRYIPSSKEQKLKTAAYLSIDSGNRVLVADKDHHRVILLDSDLQWNRIICPAEEDSIDERGVNRPHRLCYDEEKKQLIVGGDTEVTIYTLEMI